MQDITFLIEYGLSKSVSNASENQKSIAVTRGNNAIEIYRAMTN